MKQGWIKLHRTMLDNPALNNANMRAVWIECLLQATHQDRRILIGSKEVVLQAGQFVFGRNEWSKRLGIKASTLRNVISRLEREGSILGHVQGQGLPTVYQIANWNIYQQEDNPLDRSRTGQGQVEDTNKNIRIKEYKKEKINKKEKVAKHPTVESLTDQVCEEVAKYHDVSLSDVLILREKIRFHDWGSKTPKDFKKALHNWVINAIKWEQVATGKYHPTIDISQEELAVPVQTPPVDSKKLESMRSELVRRMSA